MRHTGCDQSAVRQAKQLTWLISLPFVSFALFTSPTPPGFFPAPLRMTRARDTSCITLLFPREHPFAMTSSPYPQVLGVGTTLSCMKFSPTVSGGEAVASKNKQK